MRSGTEEFWVATPFARLGLRDCRTIPVLGAVGWLPAPGEGADQGSIAAKSVPHSCGAVDHEVQAAAVIAVNAWCCCGRKPLLRDHAAFRADCLASNADPRVLENDRAPRQEARTRAGYSMVAMRIEGQPASPGLGPSAAMGLE